MASTFYNKTIIIGRLGKDPELKKGSKADYAMFPILNTTFKDGKEEINWHKVAAFGKQAILCHDYLHKGDLCCIEGRIDAREYNGNIKQTIVAERITFLSSRKPQPKTEQTEE